MIKIKPGNIWSGDKYRAVFTNPTEIAFRKGNLQNHYPVYFRDRKFADAEEAYKIFKASAPDRYELCTAVIFAKLRQYPSLVTTITANGGEDWIKKCSHHVYDKCAYWEGDGEDSGFIRCLLKAYKQIIAEGG
jgi:hypothetical protein